MDNTKVLNHISLCYGYGGIDLGLHRVFGERIRTVLVSEIETFAIENAIAKMEEGRISACPIWTDLRTIPWSLFSGKVDILSGGFPCQPFSCAGKRGGDEDPRHLFPYILRGIKECKPGVVFLENVEGIVSAKLAGNGWRDPAGTPVLLHVLRELERVGYCPTAGIFSAAEVGAPHQRKRVFILAHNKNFGLPRAINAENQGWPEWRQGLPIEGADRGAALPSRPGELANASGNGSGEGWLIQQGTDGAEPVGNGEAWRTQWPARPGEPQHEWEPPRVVADTKRL